MKSTLIKLGALAIALAVSAAQAGDVDQLDFKPCGSTSSETATANIVPNFDNPFSSILTYRFSQGSANSLNYADSIRIVTTVPGTTQSLVDKTVQICGPTAQAKQKCARQIIEKRALSGSITVPVPYDGQATNTKLYVIDSTSQRNIIEMCVQQE